MELGKFREIDIITILIAVMVSWVAHMSKHQIVHLNMHSLFYATCATKFFLKECIFSKGLS